MWTSQDEYFMNLALQEAQKAYQAEEVPVGAIITDGDEVLSTMYNTVEREGSAITHAELLAIREACKRKGEKYLPKCTLYVTLEPCAMCAGASYWAQLGKIVFGAKDEKRGYQRWIPALIHPKTVVMGGLLAEESSQLLKTFFQKRRCT